MNVKKIIAIIVCMSAVTISLCGCNDKTVASSDTKKTKESPKYTIDICMDNNNPFNEQVMTGFLASINDNFPDNNVTITTFIADDNNSVDMIVDNIILRKPSLIMAIGSNALLSAHARTDTIPIVASSIMDYERVLNIVSDKEWDHTTNTNITGVSNTPNISDVLSMMIEVTPDITNVGIIYYPGDLDSIYQNNILKTYLDEAGITYKEYEIYSPAISNDALTEIIEYACDESSVLFIPAESSLIDKAPLIGSIALNRQIPTVSADENIGEYTLCSMYNDPFNQGYSAADKAARILTGGSKISTMTISNVSTSSEQKLYNSYYADSLGLVLPKSFKERTQFLSTYIPGQNTKRNNIN